jgi:hypothetical protein
MEIPNFSELLTIVIPIVAGLVAYLYKDLRVDITMLKNEVQQKTTEAQVRQIIEDKVVPLKEDLQEIKQILDKIQDYLLSK